MSDPLAARPVLADETRAAPREPAASAEWVTATVDFTIGGQRLQAKIPTPTGPIRPRQLLPVLQTLTNLVVETATAEIEAKGHRISCAKGCGACCRQLVPITEMEAHHLRDLVEELAEPRRAEVRFRFAAARERLKEAGLLDVIRHPKRLAEEGIQPVGLNYFHLGIACPFLEEESCSIHAARPLACREYLVTSPAAHCARPTAESVRCVPLPVSVSLAAARIGQEERTRIVPHVPLVLALDWAEANPEPPPRRPGPEVLREIFDRLAGKKEETT
jgi:Fe-S-cluster containining protein